MLKPLLTSVLLLLAIAEQAFALPGDPDLAFGTGGTVVTNLGGYHEISSLAVLKDGKILAAGSSIWYNEWVVVRYLADGTVDFSFGDSGVATIPFKDNYVRCTGIAVDAQGKIVLAGRTGRYGDDCDLAVARFHPDGSLDTDFGDVGRKIFPLPGGRGAEGLLIQKDGKILLTGSGGSSQRTMVAVRYHTDGTLDSSFGSAGIAAVAFPNASAKGIGEGTGKSALLTDGRILMGGGIDGALALARLLPDGSPDKGFSGDSIVQEDKYYGRMSISSLLVDAKGKSFVVANSADHISMNPKGHVFSHDRNGTPLGLPLLPPTGLSPNFPSAIALDDRSNLLITGLTERVGESVFFSLFRLNPTGKPDLAFGKDGRVVTRIGEYKDRPLALLIQPDGKILTGGFSTGLPGDGVGFALARHEGGQVRPDLMVGSKRAGDNQYDDRGSMVLKLRFPSKGFTRSVSVLVQNDGSLTDRFTVRGSRSDANFRVRYYRGERDITTEVVTSGYVTPAMGPGKSHRIRVKITRRGPQGLVASGVGIRAFSRAKEEAKDFLTIGAFSDF